MTRSTQSSEPANASLITGKALERYFALHEALFEFAKLFDWNEPNDRAIAIVGGSFLDTQLEHMLAGFLVDDEKEIQKLLQPEGSLGSFGGRVTMAYCLGLIPKVIRDDLRLVAKVRNRFAHRLTASFGDDDIRDFCERLQWHRRAYSQPHPEATTRDLFQVGVHQLVCYLDGMVSLARAQRRELRPDPC